MWKILGKKENSFYVYHKKFIDYVIAIFSSSQRPALHQCERARKTQAVNFPFNLSEHIAIYNPQRKILSNQFLKAYLRVTNKIELLLKLNFYIACLNRNLG